MSATTPSALQVPDSSVHAHSRASRVTGSWIGSLTRRWWGMTRLATTLLLTFLLAYGDPRQLSRAIVGNPGDAYLILALLRWGGERSSHLFAGYSDGPMFASGSNAMAYSDTLLPLVGPFRFLEAVSGSPIVAFNVLYLTSWLVCCEFTYRLGLRCCCSRPAAYVGAVAFTFTTLRLGQTGHFQLMWGALVPVGFVALLRLRDRPSVSRGVVVALVVVAQFLTSAYHGVILLVGVGVLIGIYAADAWRNERFADVVGGYASALGSIAVLMTPIFLWYHAAEDDYTHHRVGYPAYFRLRLGDLRSPAPTASVPRRIPWFDTDTSFAASSSESYAYVGAFVLVLVPVFVLLAIVRRRRLFAQPGQLWALASVAIVGSIGAAIAVGRGPILSLPMPFWDVARVVLPGIESMLAIVRLFVFMQLALVLCSVVALAWILGSIPSRRGRVALATVALLVVVVDARQAIDRSVVPRVAEGSVYDVMRDLGSGKAIELPIPPVFNPGRAYLESTRMVLGSGDDLAIVNGHSGQWPVGYEETVATLNGFPDRASIAELQRIGVRYVVLHGAPVETGMDIVTYIVNNSGYAYFQPDDLERVLTALPADLVARTMVADDGVIVELRGAMPR